MDEDMELTPKIVLEVAHHEAIIRQAYKDSVGVWTWSAGITSASGHKVERYIDNPQTMQKCLEVYIWLLREKYAPAVDRAFAGHKLTEAQFAAALSFHWNTGAIGRASWVKHFKAGDTAKAKKAFMNWSKPKEIIGRRRAERDLFFSGKWSGDGKIGEYTRVTKNHSPVWSSRINVDVRHAIEAILGSGNPPVRPDAPVTPQEASRGLFAALIAAWFRR